MGAIREGVRDAVRHGTTSAMLIAVIAISVFMVSIFASIVYNLNVIENKWSKNVSISVFLSEGVDADAVFGSINSLKGVISLKYFNSEDSLNMLKKRFPNEEVIFSSSVMPSFMEAMTSANDVERLKAEIKKLPGVDDAVSNTSWFSSLKDLLSVVTYISAIMIILVSLMSLFLISYATRIGILERKYEINILRLCGATEWKLRLPHITSGVILGAIGGVTGIAFYFILKSLLEGTIKYFVDSWQTDEPYQLIAIFCLAMVLGALGNFVAFVRGTNEVDQ